MAAAKTTARDLAAEVAFLTRALKAPTLRESVDRLAERARAESWTHEEFLIACLQREVAARESHGGEGRIRAARFPARKSLEEFDFDHARGLKRELIAHLGTLDFVTARENGDGDRDRGPPPGAGRAGRAGLPGQPRYLRMSPGCGPAQPARPPGQRRAGRRPDARTRTHRLPATRLQDHHYRR